MIFARDLIRGAVLADGSLVIDRAVGKLAVAEEPRRQGGRLPGDALTHLILNACRWIDSVRWFGDETAPHPPRPAAERLTVHEVLVCVARRYPLGGWVGLLRDEGVFSPRDLPTDRAGRAHFRRMGQARKEPPHRRTSLTRDTRTPRRNQQ